MNANACLPVLPGLGPLPDGLATGSVVGFRDARAHSRAQWRPFAALSDRPGIRTRPDRLGVTNPKAAKEAA